MCSYTEMQVSTCGQHLDIQMSVSQPGNRNLSVCCKKKQFKCQMNIGSPSHSLLAATRNARKPKIVLHCYWAKRHNPPSPPLVWHLWRYGQVRGNTSCSIWCERCFWLRGPWHPLETSLHNFWDKGPSTYLAYILSFGPVCFRHLSFFSFVLAPYPIWPTPRICSWATSLHFVYCRYWPSSRILFSR